jgi:serine/threonine-protein kinase
MKKVKKLIKALGMFILLFGGSFWVGVLAFNYIVLPLWVGRYEEIQVPDVCGKTLDEAKTILSKYGLKAVVEAQKFSNVPRGVVISQHPLPIRRVRRGRKISLCVSRGQEKIRMPWLAGLSLEQAENILSSLGLKAKEVIYEYSEEIPNNEVIQTDPPADALINRNSEVIIYVSEGITTFPMPDFVGKTLREVQNEAQKIGIILDIKYIVEPSPLGIVVAQHPLPGTPVRSGKRLKVIVGFP